MAISLIEFGQNLRPTTVSVVKKVNEVIGAVNALNPSSISQLTKDVESLKASTAATDKKVAANASSIAQLQTTQAQHTTDIDKVKVTLYTPLTETDPDTSASRS